MSESSADAAGVVSSLRAAGCVFAEDEARLLMGAAQTASELERLVAERVSGTPLEHILGWAEFAGLRVVVDPGVFVPRRRTEFLVDEAVRRLSPGRRRATCLDLCCGSGAVAAAIAAAVPTAEVYAADIDPAATECAVRNLGRDDRVFTGDLFDPVPDALRGSVDVLTANAPYVPTEAIALMPPEARLHEPHATLDGGADGLDVARRIVRRASEWLAEGGVLLIETSTRQASVLARAMSVAGLTARILTHNDREATVASGTRTDPSAVARPW